MSRNPRNPVRDLREAARLLAFGGVAASEVVEAMHSTIAAGPLRRPGPRSGPIRSLVYRTVRDITRIAGNGVDRALAPIERLVPDTEPGVRRAAALAILNGVIGDQLAETHNPLAIEMRFCRDGRALDLDAESLRSALSDPSGKILVLVHGLCSNDHFWLRNGHDYGRSLAHDLGYTPVYLHYNTGLHICDNGRELSDLLEQLVAAWPVPVDDLVLIGHSMGGLVSRSACHYSESAGAEWRSKLSRLVCLGTPHHGAPLERGGNWLQVLLGVSRYSAPLVRLAKLRSAGVTDLRYGTVLSDPRDRFEPGGDSREPVELPSGVACYALAATLSPEGVTRPRGDGLVPVASALGHHTESRRALNFPAEHQHVVTETGHLNLVGDDEVYRIIKGWLENPA